MSGKTGIGVGIVGMGAYLPEEIRTNDWWTPAFVAEHLRSVDTDLVANAEHAAVRGSGEIDPEIGRHCARFAGDPFRGSRERRVIADDDQPSDMEVRACRLALTDAGLCPEDVDLLIVFSQVPDYPIPGNHALVADKLGLPHSAASMTVGSACASFVPHVRLASRLIESGEHQTALVVQSNACTRVVDPRRPSSINVGDAAVATVLQRIEPDFGYVASHLGTRGDFHAAIRLAPFGDPTIPWHRGDLHRSKLVLQTMDLKAIRCWSQHAISFCRSACQSVLTSAGYRAQDVDFFVCAQPTAWFVDACCEGLGIEPSRTLNTFKAFAHPMPASAPINLYTAYREGSLKRGDLVLLFTPGGGFTLGALLFRWLPPDRARSLSVAH